MLQLASFHRVCMIFFQAWWRGVTCRTRRTALPWLIARDLRVDGNSRASEEKKEGSVEAPGLAMMAFCEIFSSIKEVGGSMTISCYEIYNDHIYDLLDRKEQEVQIMEDAENAIQLKGLSKIPVKSLSDFEKYYFHISNQRNPPQKVENDVTVRSHKGLIMNVTSVDEESKNSLVGKLNFMELTGSSALLIDMKKYSEGVRMQMLAYFMTLYALLYTVISRVTKQPQEEVPESDWHDAALFRDSTFKQEEFVPPSPAPGFKEADLLSSILKRLGELEEMLGILQSKPSEMPHEKEELLNAAVCRVDALEAELIATK